MRIVYLEVLQRDQNVLVVRTDSCSSTKPLDLQHHELTATGLI